MCREEPPVSVVVPVFNGAQRISRCLEYLLAQSYPPDRREIIVVDNGSSDGTRELVGGFPVTLLSETSCRSPYAARNAGIMSAGGEMLAFTDADCQPHRDWLRHGVRTLLDSRADLVGGRVRFDLNDRATLGELTDALWHLDVQRQIETNRACMTANLLVRRRVIDAVGPFDPEVRSGGDGRWTRRATDAGFRLVYAPDAEVVKPPRRLAGLLAKAYRTGRGLPAAWLERGVGRWHILPAIVRNALPPSVRSVAERIEDRCLPAARRRMAGVWCTTWLMEVVRSAGCVGGCLDILRPSSAVKAIEAGGEPPGPIGEGARKGG